MSSIAEREIIVSTGENISASTFRIIRGEASFIDLNLNCLCLTSLERSGLFETDQFRSRSFYSISGIIFCRSSIIWSVEINLNNFFAIHITGVCDIDADFIVGLVPTSFFFNVEIRIFKGGVRKSITERIGYNITIVIFASLSSSNDIILIARFCVLITEVDTFLIDNIDTILVRSTIAVERIWTSLIIRDTKVRKTRVLMMICPECRGEMTARINFSRENIPDRIQTGLPRSTDPKSSVDSILFIF